MFYSISGRIVGVITPCFEALTDYFHRELLKRQFLMADETRVQVLKEPKRDSETDSYMWLFRTGEDGLPPIILYK